MILTMWYIFHINYVLFNIHQHVHDLQLRPPLSLHPLHTLTSTPLVIVSIKIIIYKLFFRIIFFCLHSEHKKINKKIPCFPKIHFCIKIIFIRTDHTLRCLIFSFLSPSKSEKRSRSILTKEAENYLNQVI